MIHTFDKSAMVNAVDDPERFTPAAPACATFCAMITPVTGAYTFTRLLG